jgi:peptidoglycan/LPS O-acetylase OafA/YrhL
MDRAAGALHDRSDAPPTRTGPTGHIGWIVAGSLVTGLLVGLLLVAAPFIPSDESELTGALLCGFALGWAMLAVLSARFSDQPQRWAAAPALFMGLGGLLLVGFGSGVHEVPELGVAPRLVGVGGLDDRPSAAAAS